MRNNTRPPWSLLAGVLVWSLFYSCLNGGVVPKPVKTAISDIQQTFAPDKRVALFHVEARAAGDTVILTGETNLPEAHAALLEKLQATSLLIIDRITLLPVPSQPSRGVVNVSVANIRSAPKHSAELATQALLGMGLKVYKQEADWYYVQTPDGYLGWLDSGAFTLMSDADYQRWLQAPKVIFLHDYGFVQDGPGPGAGRISDLVGGNLLLDRGQVGADHSVAFPDGRLGFVAASAVRAFDRWLEDHAGHTTPDLLRTAMTFMGRPYLWGGTSGKGMDCSGFTKMVYYLNGVVLPRDASQQVHAGIAVPTDSTFATLQAGDFLFFGEPEAQGRRERVRHVGIYLGDGQFIHSGADNPGVKIESLFPGSTNYAPHRRSTFLRARRMQAQSPGVVPLSDLPDFFGPRPTLIQ